MSTKNETIAENEQLPTLAWYKEQVRKLVVIRAFLISLEKEDSGGDECITDWVKRVVTSLQSALAASEALVSQWVDNHAKVNVKYVRATQELGEHRWIPVEERLPQPDETTHPQQSIKVKLTTIVEVDAWYEDCDKHWHSVRTGEVIKGTHWRPTTLLEQGECENG